jgi:outer membrane protein assembly factor BamB
VEDGFDLHQLDNGTYIRTFPTGLAQKKFPKQVLFGEGGEVVVGGSDHGSIYVFDRRTGETLQVLKHAQDGLVQTITVCGFIPVLVE